jgi:hypothetical protein
LERVGLHRLTRKQAARLVGVSPSYVSTAARFSAKERLQLRRGKLSLSQAHNHRRNADTEVDRIITKFGANAIMDALDRMTAPANGNMLTGAMVAAE